MKVSQLKSAVTRCIRAKRPAMIWGKVGVGKSSVIAQVAKMLGYDMLDMRLVQMDSVDLRGIPQVSEGRTHWAPPAEFPTAKAKKPTLIFFDELPQAAPSVTNAASQLILDRRLGSYVLPDDCVMIAAGNRDEDRAATSKLGTHILNRFVHYQLDVDASEWLKWAQGCGSIDPRIFAFVKYRPTMLHTFEASSKEKAFASPRSWEFASQVLLQLDADKVLGSMTPEERVEEFSGIIGAAAATEFSGFLAIMSQLTDIDTILLDPARASVPSDASVCYALVYALLDRADRKNLGAITTYVERFSKDWGVLFFSEVKQRKVDLCKTKEFIGWASRHPESI